MKEHQFAMYKRLFELQEEYDARNLADHKMVVRYPKKLDEFINQEIEMIKKRVGVRFSKNDIFVLAVLALFNYNQNPENGAEFYRIPNKSSLSTYIDEYQGNIIARVKELMFIEETEIMMNPKATYKTRAQKMRRFRERLPEVLR